MIVYENYWDESYSKFDLTQHFLKTIVILEGYLDSASIKCLAATNSKIRRCILSNLLHRLMINLSWHSVISENGTSSWTTNGVVRFLQKKVYEIIRKILVNKIKLEKNLHVKNY